MNAIDIINVSALDEDSLNRMIADCEMQRDIADSYVARGQMELKRRRRQARMEKQEGLPVILGEQSNRLN